MITNEAVRNHIEHITHHLASTYGQEALGAVVTYVQALEERISGLEQFQAYTDAAIAVAGYRLNWSESDLADLRLERIA